MQMQVEDDTSSSTQARKANIRVVSRGAQQQSSAKLTRPNTQTVLHEQAEEHVSANIF